MLLRFACRVFGKKSIEISKKYGEQDVLNLIQLLKFKNYRERKKSTISVQGIVVTILSQKDDDFISLTDMLKVKDGDFFISDWLRNRNTVEFLGIWERVYNPNFNYGEFSIIKSQAGLNCLKLSRNDWVEKTNAIIVL
ncbi:MAG: KilA-N domain-containing protein [Ginsengibacter sp.]